MPNQIAYNKKRISVILKKDLVEKLDNEAKQYNITRTDVIDRACREHLALELIPPSAIQVNALSDKVSLLSRQIEQQQQLIKELLKKEKQL